MMFIIFRILSYREACVIDVNIIFSKRKSYAIEVKDKEKIVVRVPYGTSQKKIEDILQQKRAWIERVRLEMPEKIVYTEGRQIPYLGRNYRLVVHHTPGKKKASLVLTEDKLIVECGCSTKSVEELVLAWYRKEARRIFVERADYYKDKIGVEYGHIYIKEQKTRWGSCSIQGNLNFNWKVIQKPIEVVDYLVVHELCHLIHMNHSKEFWRTVEQFIPDYQVRRGQL